MVKRLADLKSCYILDAATGGANMAKMLSSNLNAYIISVDIDREVAEDIYEIVDKQKVQFVLCDLASMPFRNGAFCCIVCDLTLSTIENWRHYRALKEFKRTPKARSKLYIMDYPPEESPRANEIN